MQFWGVFPSSCRVSNSWINLLFSEKLGPWASRWFELIQVAYSGCLFCFCTNMKSTRQPIPFTTHGIFLFLYKVHADTFGYKNSQNKCSISAIIENVHHMKSIPASPESSSDMMKTINVHPWKYTFNIENRQKTSNLQLIISHFLCALKFNFSILFFENLRHHMGPKTQHIDHWITHFFPKTWPLECAPQIWIRSLEIVFGSLVRVAQELTNPQSARSNNLKTKLKDELAAWQFQRSERLRFPERAEV